MLYVVSTIGLIKNHCSSSGLPQDFVCLEHGVTFIFFFIQREMRCSLDRDLGQGRLAVHRIRERMGDDERRVNVSYFFRSQELSFLCAKQQYALYLSANCS